MSSATEPASKKLKGPPAWKFLKEYVQAGEKEAVQRALSDNGVYSLEDLENANVNKVMTIAKAGTKSELQDLFWSDDFHGKLEKAINNKTLEDRLHQKEALNLFRAGLPSHTINNDIQRTAPNLFTAREGQLPPILVLGSSGSGKTTFAAKILKSRLQKDLNVQRMFTVYLMAYNVRPHKESTDNDVDAKADDDAKAKEAAENACRAIRGFIKSEIGGIGQEDRPLDIFMVVVIDEVGLDRDKLWMGKQSRLDILTTALQKIATPVQLVLAGTGLDRVSSEVNSNQDCVKIRMKPWKNEDIKWWATTCLRNSEEEQEEAFDFICRTPILKALTTNARATRFLFDTLERYGEYFDGNALIDHLVTTVAFMYIKSNGLKDLNSEDRRRVAKLVLRALSDSKKGDTNIISPNQLEPEDDGVTRAFMSLVETHIEKGKIMSGHHYAISVNPAITIVLTALMGCISTLSSPWSGSERIAALSELQRCFVTDDGDIEPRLIRSRLSFPPTNFQSRLKVPVLKNNMVLVNGRGAPYADIVGYKRLIQCKTEGNAETLDIYAELQKLGVLKHEHYAGDSFIHHRFLTNRLVTAQRDGTLCSEKELNYSSNPTPANGESAASIPNGATRFMYPMGQLDSNDGHDEIDFDEYRFEGSKFYLNDSKTPIEWNREKFDQEITVVFSTNRAGFNLVLDGSNFSSSLSRRHLDNDGQIRQEAPHSDSVNNCILEYLEKLVDTTKVKIRFQVCSH